MSAVIDHPPGILADLRERFAVPGIVSQTTVDGIPTVWVPANTLLPVLRWLKQEVNGAYPLLYDLTAIDERQRVHREGQPAADFSVVYHLISLERNSDIRLKLALSGEYPQAPSITGLWQNASWYEREVWDLFGIRFEGHPHLVRLIMPRTWEGHPLRKEHPARATEFEHYHLDEARQAREQAALQIDPEEWGMSPKGEDHDYMILNLGPNHPSVHGVFRVMLQLDGEEIVESVPDIGYHHRGAEKMGERQSWHTYIPYTDRIDYLGGVMNNLPYLMAVEQMAGNGRSRWTIAVTGEALDVGIDDAVRLGAVINELVMNAVKYAFDGVGENGRVLINCQRDGEEVVVTVNDNGAGMTGDSANGLSTRSSGLGTRLVDLYLGALEGSMERTTACGRGTVCVVRAPYRPPGPPRPLARAHNNLAQYKRIAESRAIRSV